MAIVDGEKDLVDVYLRLFRKKRMDAMRMITTLGSPVKFIFLSADATVRDEATQMGAIFLKKPASLRELMQAIEALAGLPAGPGSNDVAPDGGFSPGLASR